MWRTCCVSCCLFFRLSRECVCAHVCVCVCVHPSILTELCSIVDSLKGSLICVCLFVSLTVCVSVCLCVCVSAYLCVCVSVVCASVCLCPSIIRVSIPFRPLSPDLSRVSAGAADCSDTLSLHRTVVVMGKGRRKNKGGCKTGSNAASGA